MLQCTAVTPTPEDEALEALEDMEGAPDDADFHIYSHEHLLCQLGEHDEKTEHAAHIWTTETQPPRSLWFRWTGAHGHRVYRLVTLAMCPAILSDLEQGSREWCGLFDDHPTPHSFYVTDPLRDLLIERARREARRLTSEYDADGCDDYDE